MTPPDVGARHDHRTPSGGKQTDRAVERVAVGQRRSRRSGQRPGRPAVGGDGKDVIHGEVDERNTRRRTDRGPQRLVDQPGDRVTRRRGGGESGERCHERHMVDLLQRSHPPSPRRRPPAENQQRRRVLLGGSHCAHPVRHARARGQRGHARLACHFRPAFGRERRGLLVAGVDQPDTLTAATVVDRKQMTAGQRENGVDPAGFQPPGDQSAGVEGVLGVVAHARSLSAPLGYFRGKASNVTLL